MSNYRKTMADALQEMYLSEDNIDLMRKAAGGAAQTVKMKDGKLQMDGFTASAIMQVYDKVNPANQKKMAVMINKGTKAGMLKLQSFAMKQVKSEYGEEVELDEWTVSDVEIAMKKKYGKIDKEAIEKLKKIQHRGNVDRNDLVKVGHGKLNVAGLAYSKEEVELDEFTISDLKGMGIKPTPAQMKELQKIVKDKHRGTVGNHITRADLRKVGIEEEVDLDEAVKHMEVPPDAARGRGVPMAHPDRIGYDSKENQQAYNSITHGSPDNQIDVAKHFMKKGLKSKALHKAVADELGVIHWEIHKQLTHDKSKLHPLHMSFEGEELDEGKEKGPKQLTNPNKEVMVVKKNKVVVIDKKDQDKYLKQGWTLAEESDLMNAVIEQLAKIKGNSPADKGRKAAVEDDIERAEKKGDKKEVKKLKEVELDEIKKGTRAELIALNKELKVAKKKKDKEKVAALQKELDALLKSGKGKKIGPDWMHNEEADLDEGNLNDYVTKFKQKLGKTTYQTMTDWVDGIGGLTKREASTLKLKLKPFTEEVDLDEGKMSDLHQLIKDKKSAEEIAKIMKLDVKTIKSLMSSYESTDGDTMGENGKYMEMLATACGGASENMNEGAAADARRAMSKDPDFSRKDSADDDDSATDDDIKGASKNIIMQLRKSISLKGRFDVEFLDKKKFKVPAKMAMAVTQKYNSLKKPVDKEKFQTQIAKSYKDMLKTLKAGYHGEQKESILDRIDRKIKENKNG